MAGPLAINKPLDDGRLSAGAPDYGAGGLNISAPLDGARLRLSDGAHEGGSSAQLVSIAGVTPTPSGNLIAHLRISTQMAAITPAPSGYINIRHNPNLLSAIHKTAYAAHQHGISLPLGVEGKFKHANPCPQYCAATYAHGADISGTQQLGWWNAEREAFSASSDWNRAASSASCTRNTWLSAPLLAIQDDAIWQEGAVITAHGADYSRDAVRIEHLVRTHWNDAITLTHAALDAFAEGIALRRCIVTIWRDAGIPGNEKNPPKHIKPKPFVPPWRAKLQIRCALPGNGTLRIDRAQCLAYAEVEIQVRMCYMIENSASLSLLDGTPLPCTSMQIETDYESWCWGLTATLLGRDAWELVQPNPLACEVKALINGMEWRFLLDEPKRNQAFNSDRVSISGRSRSAWLHTPYHRPFNVSQENARDMSQLAEAALDNTGWAIDWQLDDWLVPASMYTSNTTPIQMLLKLAEVSGNRIYTHPHLQIITAHKRWPVASWLLDGQVCDISIQDSAIISKERTAIFSPLYNGCYVGGESHGVMALVRIAGTDGTLLPGEPVTDILLCDNAGVAARARGLNILSDSGPGVEVNAELPLHPDIGLIEPGKIVDLGGTRGISRSIRITADSSGNFRQSVSIERRNVED